MLQLSAAVACAFVHRGPAFWPRTCIFGSLQPHVLAILNAKQFVVLQVCRQWTADEMTAMVMRWMYNSFRIEGDRNAVFRVGSRLLQVLPATKCSDPKQFCIEGKFPLAAGILPVQGALSLSSLGSTAHCG